VFQPPNFLVFFFPPILLPPSVFSFQKICEVFVPDLPKIWSAPIFVLREKFNRRLSPFLNSFAFSSFYCMLCPLLIPHIFLYFLVVFLEFSRGMLHIPYSKWCDFISLLSHYLEPLVPNSACLLPPLIRGFDISPLSLCRNCSSLNY